MPSTHLSSNHHRRLETVLHVIELRLRELQTDLRSEATPLTYQLEPALSEDQKMLLSHQINAIQALIGQLITKYGLTPRTVSWAQRLSAVTSSLWVDSRIACQIR